MQRLYCRLFPLVHLTGSLTSAKLRRASQDYLIGITDDTNISNGGKSNFLEQAEKIFFALKNILVTTTRIPAAIDCIENKFA